MEYCKQEKHCPTLLFVPNALNQLGIGGARIVLEGDYCAGFACDIRIFLILSTESNAGLELTFARQLYGKLVCILHYPIRRVDFCSMPTIFRLIPLK